MEEATRSGSIRASYDRLAADYSAQLFHELARKPIDRALLDESPHAPTVQSVTSGAGPGTQPAN